MRFPVVESESTARLKKLEHNNALNLLRLMISSVVHGFEAPKSLDTHESFSGVSLDSHCRSSLICHES